MTRIGVIASMSGSESATAGKVLHVDFFHSKDLTWTYAGRRSSQHRGPTARHRHHLVRHSQAF
jgi:hypothetical protein